MIIGINGKIGSGKDTVGILIQHLIAEHKGSIIQEYQFFKDPLGKEKFTLIEYLKQIPTSLQCDSGWEIKKYAAKLKQIGSILSGIDVEKFEDQEFKKTLMSSDWDYDSEPMIVREFLQKLGTEAMRDGLHTNVWVNALFADYKMDYVQHPDIEYVLHKDYPNWIITDMRFPNELEAVIKKGGITIRVTRSCGSSNFEGTQEEWDKLVEKNKQALHPSETALDSATFDYEIINDGTIEELIEKVKEILIKEKII